MATQIKKNNTAVKTANEKIEEKVEKVSTRVEPIIEKNSEVEIEMEKLREENAEKTKALEDLTRQFASMQELLNKMVLEKNSKAETKTEDDEVLVGCRFINGGSFATNDNRMVCSFDRDEEKYVSAEDLKIYLKEAGRNYRSLFEIDGFYFVDPKNYERFKIRKKIDLSREKIKEIVFAPTQHEVINRFNALTNNKSNFNVMHLFEYEVCKMLIDPTNPLMGWDYANRTALEDYIGIKFDELLARLSARDYAIKNR